MYTSSNANYNRIDNNSVNTTTEYYKSKLNQFKNEKVKIFYKNHLIKQVTINNLLDCCPICQNNFFGNKKLSILTCGHVFHKECVQSWIKQDTTCPTDRRQITELIIPDSLEDFINNLKPKSFYPSIFKQKQATIISIPADNTLEPNNTLTTATTNRCNILNKCSLEVIPYILCLAFILYIAIMPFLLISGVFSS